MVAYIKSRVKFELQYLSLLSRIFLVFKNFCRPTITPPFLFHCSQVLTTRTGGILSDVDWINLWSVDWFNLLIHNYGDLIKIQTFDVCQGWASKQKLTIEYTGPHYWARELLLYAHFSTEHNVLSFEMLSCYQNTINWSSSTDQSSQTSCDYFTLPCVHTFLLNAPYGEALSCSGPMTTITIEPSVAHIAWTPLVFPWHGPPSAFTPESLR